MPKTGRFHQIRIQLANMGHPILGDAKYSAQKPLPDKSIALYNLPRGDIKIDVKTGSLPFLKKTRMF